MSLSLPVSTSVVGSAPASPPRLPWQGYRRPAHCRHRGLRHPKQHTGHGQALGCRAVTETSIAQKKYEIGAHSAGFAIEKWQRTRQDHHVFIVVWPRDGG